MTKVDLARGADLIRFHLQGSSICDEDRLDLMQLAEYLEDRGAPCTTTAPDATADGYDWPAEAESILREAHAAVYGDRQADYGHPRQNFTRTAIGWHMVLMHKLADGETITPQDVALCMVQVKVAREVHEPKRDNRVDGAGYWETLDRLETGR